MPYILNKTDGSKLVTLEDATLDVSTNLTFVGRNYVGYGEIQNENFLKLLENFNNTTAPSKPIQGQLWYDSENNQLKVCSDGKNFKGLATLRVQTNQPNASVNGELWWDVTNGQLKIFNGSTYITVGPQTSSSARSSIVFEEEIDQLDFGVTNTPYPIIKVKVGSDVIATMARLDEDNINFALTPRTNVSNLDGKFQKVRRGITLQGADSVTGSSTSTGYYFWGTAAESLSAVSATSIVSTVSTASGASHFVPFFNGQTGARRAFTTSTFFFTPSTNVLNVTATAARYADLAEMYLADQQYPVGTVVVIGGTAEVTASSGGERAIGVVSANPAYLMNETLVGGTPIALKGRVPVKIRGEVKKGQNLIAGPEGKAMVSAAPFFANIFAVALEDSQEGRDWVEAVVL